MNILLLDIETAPNLADVWDLWNVNVSLSQLRQSSYTMCYGFKWYGKRKFFFERIRPDGLDLDPIWDALNEADVAVHYNGDRFDIPILQKDFLLAEYSPPSTFANVDLLSAVKKKFRFPSYKLDYVASTLLGIGKEQHSGHELWVRCMAGDEKAWREMEKYNKQDVLLLEPLYDRLLPWIPGLPNALLYGGQECPRCGLAGGLSKQGTRKTATRVYQQWKCDLCGGWSSSTKSEYGVELRNV